MTIKKQMLMLKENWLITLLAVVLLGMVFFGNSSGNSGNYAMQSFAESVGMEKGYSLATDAYRGGIAMPSYDSGFAPEETARLITKTGSLTAEVEHGTFRDAEEKLKAIIKASEAYLLNENVNAYDSGWKEYFYGYYNIKVDTSKYDAVVLQLKEIGEVKSFTESSDDITAQHKNLETELKAGKDMLARYKDMLAKADKMEDQITLSDKIYYLEMSISYLEDALKNMDNRIDYSTIYFSISEKQSGYSGIVFVKLSDLTRSLVNSLNGLLKLLFSILPYAVVAGIGYFIYRKVKRK